MIKPGEKGSYAYGENVRVDNNGNSHTTFGSPLLMIPTKELQAIPEQKFVNTSRNIRVSMPDPKMKSPSGEKPLAYSSKQLGVGADGKIVWSGYDDPGKYAGVTNDQLLRAAKDTNIGATVKSAMNGFYAGKNKWNIVEYGTGKEVVGGDNFHDSAVKSMVHLAKNSPNYANAKDITSALTYDPASNALTVDKVKFEQYVKNKYGITKDKYTNTNTDGKVFLSDQFMKAYNELLDSVDYTYSDFLGRNEATERQALTSQNKTNASKTAHGPREQDEDTERRSKQQALLKAELSNNWKLLYNDIFDKITK